MKRCALYARTECEDAESIALQVAILRGCVARMKEKTGEDWQVVAVYRDDGFSGSTLDRPSLCRMMEDAVQGKVDVLISYEISRLTGNPDDLKRLLEFAAAKGVELAGPARDETGQLDGLESYDAPRLARDVELLSQLYQETGSGSPS